MGARTRQRTCLYFAYGSNMDQAQMARRCPDAMAIDVAVLRHHGVEFTGRSPAWGGGVATLVRRRGADTTGVVYEMPDMRVLDAHEGHPNVYRRVRRKVATETYGELTAYTYVRPFNRRNRPAAAYVDAIARGCYDFGIDARPILSAALGWTP